MLTINQRFIATAVFNLFSLTAMNANAESIAGQGKCTYNLPQLMLPTPMAMPQC